MATIEEAERIASSLPGAQKDEKSFLYRVSGRNFLWVYLERVHPRKRRVPNPEVLGLRVSGDDAKQDMLAAEPAKFFTTGHYDGYPAVLLRLAEVDAEELEELIVSAWECVAGPRLIASYRGR